MFHLFNVFYVTFKPITETGISHIVERSMVTNAIKIYSHVKEYRYEVSVRGDPRTHLERFCRFFNLPTPRTTPDRTRVKLKKGHVQRQLGLEGLGMVLQVRKGRYSIWYQTAKTALADIEVACVVHAVADIKTVERVGIVRAEYYVCVAEAAIPQLMASLPGAGEPRSDGLARRKIKTFDSKPFSLTRSVKDEIPARLELYRPTLTRTRGYAKLELRTAWKRQRRALSRSDRRAMVYALREMVAQTSVPTFTKPGVWNGLRVKPNGRVGHTERAVTALLKQAPERRLSFNTIDRCIPYVTRRNLRATVQRMVGKGIVVVGWRGGRLRSVQLRTLTLVQQPA